MPGNPLTDPNWATDTADTVVRVVGQVRDKTTTPIVHAARGLVFGVLAVFLGVFAFLALLIGVLRGTQEVLDLIMDYPQAVYTSYLIIGGIFCIGGLILFKKRGAGTV